MSVQTSYLLIPPDWLKTFQVGSFLSPNSRFQKKVGFFHADIGLYLPLKTAKKRPMHFF